jgi:hypothetical protein
VFLEKLHEAQRRFDRLFLRFQIKNRISPDDVLGVDERPVDRGPCLAKAERAPSSRLRPAAVDHRAGF